MINIAREFSRAPIGRYISDGPNSGERFRDQFLVPALKKSERLILEMDGVRSYGSSFLEEAFGGLVRVGYAPSELLKRIVFKSTDPSIPVEVRTYWH